MRLSKTHERWIYVISGVLFLSGVGWLVAHYFFAPANEFGVTAAPSEPWWLRIHGAAAMAALIVFGTLFPGHIARAWAFGQNLKSGLTMIGILAALILTGYGLYYAGDEETRPWISLVHWGVGIVAVAGLITHVRLGKRRSPSPSSIGMQDLAQRPRSNPRASASEVRVPRAD